MTTSDLLKLMTFFLFSGGIALLIFGGSLALLGAGRRIGQEYLTRQGADSMSGLNAVEGAVFALMGLLLAFAISGALQRFDERRGLILQEANAIATAGDRLQLLDADARRQLKPLLVAYAEARLTIYKAPIEFSITDEAAVYSPEAVRAAAAAKAVLWKSAAAYCPFGISNTGCVLTLPSLSAMFEAAKLRRGANERHPPQAIYIMLFGLALGASLLAGFSMAAAKSQSIVHMLVFATALAVTLYIVTDIEFPRMGLIRVDYFDHFLEEVIAELKATN
ncbi:MAG: hypothetical protein MUC37_10590 [Hyphomicrobium sp.]|nr:hypothetical protein [Hyphomicrobium sp.]